MEGRAGLADMAVKMPLAAQVTCDAVLWVDTDLKVRYASPGVARICRAGARRLEGDDLAEAGLRPSAMAALLSCVGAAIAEMQPVLSYFELDDEGSLQPFAAEAVPVPGIGGALGHVLVVARQRDDTTLRSIAETDNAAEAIQVRDRLLALAADELRASLHEIRNWTQVLMISERQTPPPPAVQRALSGLACATEHQMQLVNDMLDTSQVHEGQFSLELRPIKLRRAVVAAVEQVRQRPESEGISLVVHAPTDLWVNGDYAQLEKSFVKLILSAVARSSIGSRVIIVLERSGRFANVTIRDRCEDCDAQSLTRQFEWPMRCPGDPLQLPFSLVVGLALAQHVCQQHGGWIRVLVHAPPGNPGVELCAVLPLCKAPDALA